ncbi:hypothetical protein F5I97DRAFT_316633 [Phlebopus sp. FC_14]|nr:hypothetical protein F5I97DRAFT_316633 [Phlebopus sp. FC_14]
MLARTVSASHNAPGRRFTPRYQLFPKVKRVKLSRETKPTLALLLRPSSFSWKRLFHRIRSSRSRSSTDIDTIVASTSSESETTTLVDTKSEYTGPKKVRFDDEPKVFFQKSRIRIPKASSQRKAERPCLVVRKFGDLYALSKGDADSDSESIYEDCASDYVGLKADLEALEDREFLKQLQIEEARTSLFYETEFGCTAFDRKAYAHYCLGKFLDKQREEAWSPKKPVFENPVLPTRTLPAISFELPEWARPRPMPVQVTPPPRPLLERIHKRIVDEIENAVVVLIIGITIHTCIYAFFFYKVFTRGLRSDN